MQYFIANWPAPHNISALTTTRLIGASKGCYASNNLALHVEDDVNTVMINRSALRAQLALPSEPQWLQQTHSSRVVAVDTTKIRDADAAITRATGQVLAILTADCLPIMLCDTEGREVAAIHAGWRGLAAGIIASTVAQMQSKSIMAWIGPSICRNCYAIGDEMRAIILQKMPRVATAFYQKEQQYYADLVQIAALLLQQQGITAIYYSNICSYEEKGLCYSYRRDGETGRMVTLIWIKEP